jgi:hypothetical protein
MDERQLRSRSIATVVDVAPRDAKSYHDSRESGYNVAENKTLGNKESNAQIEIQIGDEEERHLTIKLTTQRNQMTMFSKQVERFMEC